VASGWQQFVNEPDTDFALPHHVEWGQHIVDAWLPRHGDRAAKIPVVMAGEELFDDREVRPCLDPSRPGVIVAQCRQATENDANHAVTCAREDPDGWRRLSIRERFERLGRVAQGIRKARADIMGAAMANGGKTLAESDPEVSEAVDFIEFYRDTARWYQELPGISGRPRGVVVVVPPWNFPIAIPCGGVAVALAAGNTVLLKPASDAALVAWELCRCFWDAGVPRSALQFLPCGGAAAGRHLVNHPGVDSVILTGGTATAMSMLRDRPDLNLAAETGGKNATIVTALADRDQAIKHAVHSAFSHSGQKCSATSLLLLEAEVYDDRGFRRALCDAVESLPVGSAWDPKTRVGPLIRSPSGELEKALKLLEPGEEWAVRPRQSDHNPNLWTPGVKYGVRSGSKTHLTEFFGPLLGVMRFESLAEAIALVNQTGYGLTSGLESLDAREQDEWLEQVQAGNLYVNRVTTGAVVLRQPFGGIGKSAFGPGIKAGGPNYVAQFMEFEETAPVSSTDLPADHPFAGFLDVLKANLSRLGENGPAELSRLRAAVHSYERALQEEFGCEHDHFRLIGQDNIRRYRKVVDVRIRLHPDDSPFDVLARIVAARTVGCLITVSVPEGMTSPVIALLREAAASWTVDFEITEESDRALAELIRSNRAGRLRYGSPGRVPDLIRIAAAETGLWIAARPVLGEGRLELLWYVQEQSLSRDYHRYGNLGRRKGESRADTL
jgi:RHH-type proline utilization regulon transcriptional repressor/proline dehydrogenase/delta 1-pyrroline-5-carboxylate dehydrogenase